MYITKSEKFSNGVDLYMTSQKFIRSLGKKLKDNFGGELKVSSKLYTQNKQGKELHRVNVLFRQLKCKRGDIVSIRGERLKLTSVGNKISARNLKTGRRVSIRSSDLPRY